MEEFFVSLVSYFAICFVYYVLLQSKVVGISQMFVKANEKPWKAAIPIYNTYTLFKLTWSKVHFWIYMLLWGVCVCTFVVFVIMPIKATLLMFVIITLLMLYLIAYYYHIAKCYSYYPVFYTFALLIFPPITYAIMGFGLNEYERKIDERKGIKNVHKNI